MSRTTVSNAYNRPGELSPELRDRILGAAAELGYRGPDVAARMLRTGRRGAIGLLFTEDLSFVFSDPDTTGFLQGVADASARSGIGLMLLPSPPDIEVAASVITSVAVDGHIVFSVGVPTAGRSTGEETGRGEAGRNEDGRNEDGAADPALDAILALDQPMVVVDEPDLGPATSFVGIDDRAGAELAAGHLVELGHRRIAVVLGRTRRGSTAGRLTREREAAVTARVVRDRLAGYRSAMDRAGLDPTDLVVWESGGNGPDQARRATADLLAAHPDLTGLLCYSDQVAIGACQAATGTGRRVPDDLSVVGFDDVPRAATWEPQLTTVRQPIVEKGKVAAELLLATIDGAPPRRVQLPVELVVRRSTARPADNPVTTRT